MMDYALSVRLLLDSITDGHVMRKAVGRIVQAMAFAVGFAMLLSWIGLWYMIGDLAPMAALALTFTQIVLVGAMIKVVQIIYHRGEDICQLGESDFSMMAVFATLARVPGEAALVFYGLLSLPALLLIWSGAGHIVALFGVPVLGIHWSIAGVVAMITCWLIAFASFVVFALAAEAVSALFTIAHDLRCMRQHSEAQHKEYVAANRIAA